MTEHQAGDGHAAVSAQPQPQSGHRPIVGVIITSVRTHGL